MTTLIFYQTILSSYSKHIFKYKKTGYMIRFVLVLDIIHLDSINLRITGHRVAQHRIDFDFENLVELDS